MSSYVRKTADEFHVEGDFGQGWEMVTAEDTRAEGRARLREYRENDPDHAYRLRTVRVPKGSTVAPAHACGLCDAPLVFAGMEGRYATFTCSRPGCDWWHIATDCCADEPEGGASDA